MKSTDGNFNLFDEKDKKLRKIEREISYFIYQKIVLQVKHLSYLVDIMKQINGI